MGLLRVEDVLAGILARRRREDAELRPMRVVGRDTDGTVLLRRFDGECVQRSDVCSAYEGQIVELPCAPPFRTTGAAGIPAARTGRKVSALWLESIEPDFFLPGESLTVTITGKGFLPTFQLDLLLPDSDELNPFVTVLERRTVSATEAEMDIEIAADAPPIAVALGDVAYDNVGAPL